MPWAFIMTFSVSVALAGQDTTRKSKPSGDMTLPMAWDMAVLRDPLGPFNSGIGTVLTRPFIITASNHEVSTFMAW